MRDIKDCEDTSIRRKFQSTEIKGIAIAIKQGFEGTKSCCKSYEEEWSCLGIVFHDE